MRFVLFSWIVDKYDILLTKTDLKKRTCVHLAAFATPAAETNELVRFNLLLNHYALVSRR